MTDPTPESSLEQLHELWSSGTESRSDREHAFWEYWERVTNAQERLDESQWEELFAVDLNELGFILAQVIGHLAARDLVPVHLEPRARAARGGPGRDRVRARLGEIGGYAPQWAEAQLTARACVRVLRSGSVRPEQWLDHVVRKGTIWAALECVPFLSSEELEAMRHTSELRRVFTRGQRAQLRDDIAAELRRRVSGSRK